MRTIDTTEALTLLNRAVEEKGKDFIYEDQTGSLSQCAYFHGDEPGCIVGHVMSYVGVKPEHLVHQEENFNRGATIDSPDLAKALAENADIEFTDDAKWALLQAQCDQDRGAIWGDALASAEVWASEN